MSEISGKNFILDERIRGRITIIAPKKVTKEEAFRVFESVLEVKGFTLVESGKVIKIVRSADARKSAIETHVEPRVVPQKDIFITQLLPLTYVEAEDMSKLLKDFVSKNGKLVPYPPTNILIFIDTASNIARLQEIINTLDVKGFEEQIEIIPLENAMARTLVNTLTRIFEVGKAAPKKRRRRSRRRTEVPDAPGVSKIIANDRTNSLIVIATREMMEKVKDIIVRLDAPIEVGEGKIHVRYMENARAEELAQVMNSLISSSGGKRRRKGRAQAPALQLEGAVKITSDKATNSLIIIASRSDLKTLEMVIDRLDRPRKQVYVEGVIMEISLDKTRELGLVLHGAAPVDDGAAFGGTSLGGLNTLGMTADATSLGAIVSKGGLFTGVLGKPITLDIGGTSVSVPGFGALINLLAGDEDVNILSTPQLLTMNNEEAEIIVGSNVPFITGQSVTTGGTTMQTIERQDVGIKLNITPQINEKGFVRLAIFQEISQVSEQLPTGFDVSTAGLITRKRSARTTVVIEDEQTVVLGGLLEDNVSVSERKVPLLGDIPIIGWLFRSSRKRRTKTNLLIFLTPYIIDINEDLDELTIRKNIEMQQFQKQHNINQDIR